MCGDECRSRARPFDILPNLYVRIPIYKPAGRTAAAAALPLRILHLPFILTRADTHVGPQRTQAQCLMYIYSGSLDPPALRCIMCVHIEEKGESMRSHHSSAVASLNFNTFFPTERIYLSLCAFFCVFIYFKSIVVI